MEHWCGPCARCEAWEGEEGRAFPTPATEVGRDLGETGGNKVHQINLVHMYVVCL